MVGAITVGLGIAAVLIGTEGLARTVTVGGAISGYCAIGSVKIAMAPTITVTMERTAAKTGRSMKK